MPITELFHIDRFQTSGKDISATVALNPVHPIFSGHFPGQPVLPGVCMIRIVKELLENATKNALTMVRADQIKFLTVIDPRHTVSFEATVNFDFDNEGELKAGGSFFNGDTVYFKLQGATFISKERKGAKA
jgi:3-hydroxyacyl-[acyl-carrier-protein] dehydratase